ncbi:MAG: dephospho-CoA kinase [Firmicutes bacterium]|nr:dephospho-CoA kinase [Candidatus Caballimonas caccae]
MMQNNVKKIAVTGGIGSGKSTLIRILNELGYYTVSCDEEIKKMYQETEIVDNIKSMFPEAVENNKLNKNIIAKIVFNDIERLKKLNEYMHPIVLKRCFDKANRESINGVAFIEVPLLFESKLENSFDKVIVVVRDREQRIESIISRSNLSWEEIEKRMNNQIDYDKNDLSKYIVIRNDGDIYDHREKILPIIDKIICI